ncbi:hypothetical protein SAMN04488056_106163 [Cohaesibacter marisflavi]|uniref:Lipoprotein n=1 Tax=Cohaesibacter marisflavi TaxID=655353 RepID=A0A1I5HCR8_9HYPH|nr:hypothetical protein SAMN04488056_106163 [Cohaesibacter marisflavi]
MPQLKAIIVANLLPATMFVASCSPLEGDCSALLCGINFISRTFVRLFFFPPAFSIITKICLNNRHGYYLFNARYALL